MLMAAADDQQPGKHVGPSFPAAATKFVRP
jgi:hypothetical protein